MSTALLLPTLDAHDGASVDEQLQAALVELIDVAPVIGLVPSQLPYGSA